MQTWGESSLQASLTTHLVFSPDHICGQGNERADILEGNAPLSSNNAVCTCVNTTHHTTGQLHMR